MVRILLGELEIGSEVIGARVSGENRRAYFGNLRNFPKEIALILASTNSLKAIREKLNPRKLADWPKS